MTRSVWAALLAMLCLLSACNTVRGMGRDVEEVGRGIRRAF